jgi:hypothetical protein
MALMHYKSHQDRVKWFSSPWKNVLYSFMSLPNSNKGKTFFALSKFPVETSILQIWECYAGKETHLTTRIDEGVSTGHLFTLYFKRVVGLCRLFTQSRTLVIGGSF